jgi:hypothetical protein
VREFKFFRDNKSRREETIEWLRSEIDLNEFRNELEGNFNNEFPLIYLNMERVESRVRRNRNEWV